MRPPICPATFGTETLAPPRGAPTEVSRGPGQIRSEQSPIWPIRRPRSCGTLQVTGLSYPMRMRPRSALTPTRSTERVSKTGPRMKPEPPVVGGPNFRCRKWSTAPPTKLPLNRQGQVSSFWLARGDLRSGSVEGDPLGEHAVDEDGEFFGRHVDGGNAGAQAGMHRGDENQRDDREEDVSHDKALRRFLHGRTSCSAKPILRWR
jgi:hypothetical protein